MTTLDRSISPGEYHTKGKPYRVLAREAGWPIVVREDLMAAGADREGRRRALVSFAHLTDLHVIDAASPSHASFLRQYRGSIAGAPLSNASRPQDTLTVHVLDAMVRRINAIGKGPVSGRPFDFAISTGDNADSRSTHELEAVIDVLNGKKTTFNAAGGLYMGLQDMTPGEGDAYDAFWHPEPVKGGQKEDLWKRAYGYPSLEGFIEAVSAPIQTQGLALRWYSGFGNHDILDEGVIPAGVGAARLLEALATGNRLPTGLPKGMDVQSFLGELMTADDRALMALIDTMPMRTITPSSKRKPFTRADFVRLHLEQEGPKGPAGHGFSQANLAQQTAYYRFQMADGVVGIMLDSTNPNGGADGSLDPAQAAWLTKQLESVHSRYLTEKGSSAETGRRDQLVVLFCHHNSRTFDNLTKAHGETKSDRIGSDDFLALLARFPNVVLWVNGHTHCNRVWSHPAKDGRGHGLWEINTASHIDYPQQARTIEIVDNGDETLSIFAVMIDHSDPEAIKRTGLQNRASLAALSLEAAVNDPALDRPYRLGLPEDLNVELLIRKPFA
ncbi:TIGR03767 family metallophosphoesterase [Bradyrhizobium sp. LHD-71]|uniref:TIGR03767 family metallophosphoesterase n=1 Tax=Bradyrhizobium sp. LHD-71 TaxID=3072141 RepID=UPI00280CD6BC|nr:TIGR03767 family metallophosphoesterase [Bradyrhizobium sp. LHD-71]MDQ8729151.1 TIGR03767 family metallophosphoesterase [Bradyrhizobium sp. LHD-71]